MNSIEFIEELIQNIETNIYITESVLKTYDEDSDDEEEINTLKNNLEYLKERLKYSKQIKNELEAWETIKKDFKIGFDEEDENKGYFIAGKDYYGKNSTIFSYIKSHYEKLKKALEVKDE